MVLEKTLESPLDCKEIKPVNPKGNQPWLFIGRTDAEAEAPKLWPPDENSQLIGKDSDAGKDWRKEDKWATENEMVGWHHQLNGHEFEQTLGDSEGQWSLMCCSPWGQKESDMTEQLNNKWVKYYDLLYNYKWGNWNSPTVFLERLLEKKDCIIINIPHNVQHNLYIAISNKYLLKMA